MTSSNNIKIIEAKGKPKEIGEAIGESGRDLIAVNIDDFLAGKDSEKIFNRASKYWNAAWRNFPGYLTELQGISRGANVPLMRLFAYSAEEELGAKEDHCTTIAAKTGESTLLGHNEDWSDRRKFYIVRAKPENHPEFISFDYAGHLPGSSAALNSAGVAFAGNSIYTRINEDGLPKSYLLRSLLEVTSLHDIKRVMSLYPRASGNNSAIVFSEEKIIADVEWSPDDYIIIRPKENHYAHTNHFTHLKIVLPGDEDYQAESSSRLNRANRLLKSSEIEFGDCSVDAFKRILRDHEGREGAGSICKHLYEDGKAGSDTLASIIIEADKGIMHALTGKPCQAEYQQYTL